MIVENGEGKENANSYVSVDFANEYFSSRGATQWDDIDDATKKQLLIKATDFIDNSFKWYGKKKSPTQALRFPRDNLKDYEGNVVNGIPTCLRQAVCEASLIAIRNSLFATANENGNITSETIGALHFSYAKSENASNITLYDSINKRLQGLFKDKTNQSIIQGRVERGL